MLESIAKRNENMKQVLETISEYRNQVGEKQVHNVCVCKETIEVTELLTFQTIIELINDGSKEED